ncbi:MAG: S41 family peptidase [Planctomycetota bacterium]|nr:S41 family peptidase [Planctomycetota bacterium]
MDRGIAGVIFAFGLLTGVLLAFTAEELWPRASEADVAEYREVRDFAREAFVGDVSDDELVKLALDGMLRGLDHYSRYYDIEQSKVLERETQGRYKGIGAIFRTVASGKVLYPLTDSPAARGGLQVGDQFLTVAGSPFVDLDEAGFRELLAAPPGGLLEATVEGLDGTRRELEIRPGSVVDPTVRHSQWLDEERGIAYLAITSFSSETPAEFDRALQFLHRRGARAIAIDLRGNLGGVLESAIAVAQRFIPEGPLLSTEGRGEPVVYHADTSLAAYRDVHLVVLVDKDTASASEILAGALQDYRRAVLVGAPTYGKGMVQTIRRFDRWSTRAKVTSSYYYSPAGRNFERTSDEDRDHGILPDVLIEVDDLTRARLHRYLRSYGPGPEAIEALEAWELAEGVDLLDDLPRDAQLLGALGLFHGERPGAQPLRPE